MRAHGVEHYENSWLNVHYVVLFRIEKEPVIKQSKLGVCCSHSGRARGQQPSNDCPARNDVRAQKLICGVNHTNYESY
jgi:hypothetical protein